MVPASVLDHQRACQPPVQLLVLDRGCRHLDVRLAAVRGVHVDGHLGASDLDLAAPGVPVRVVTRERARQGAAYLDLIDLDQVVFHVFESRATWPLPA